jgi:hypothetical protein
MLWMTAAAFTLAPALGAGAPPTDEGDQFVKARHAAVRRTPGGAAFVSVGTGALDMGYSFEGGSWMQLFATQQVEGRFLFQRFTLEASLLHALPVSGSLATRAFVTQLRLGWTGERFAITGGPSFQIAPEAKPSIQLLPTIRAAWMISDSGLGLSAGIFDLHAEAPVRLSIELSELFGFGYAAPLGLEAHAALPLGRDFQLRAQGLALRAANAKVAMLLVSAALTAFDIGGAP